jgi:hypothetical protein
MPSPTLSTPSARLSPPSTLSTLSRDKAAPFTVSVVRCVEEEVDGDTLGMDERVLGLFFFCYHAFTTQLGWQDSECRATVKGLEGGRHAEWAGLLWAMRVL